MFTFGEQLYRTTQRDEETLLVDPVFRFAPGTIAAASASGSVDIPVPLDRSLFVHSFTIELGATALSTWELVFLTLKDRVGATLPGAVFAIGNAGQTLVGESQANSGVGAGCRFNRVFQLILPPGISAISCTAQRLVTTNAATFGFGINGYTIPPGRIGRA